MKDDDPRTFWQFVWAEKKIDLFFILLFFIFIVTVEAIAYVR